LAPPLLDPCDKEVCFKSVPIQGKVPPGAEPVVLGGESAKLGSLNSNTGRFCVDVNLRANEDNTLEFRSARDGVYSTAVTIKVTQKKCKDDVNPKDPPKKTPKMVSLGAKATSKKEPKSGNVGMLTDGKSGAAAVFEFYDWGSTTTWVLVKLEKQHMVDRVVVRWRDAKGSGTAYGKEYRVLLAANPSTDPNLDDGRWTERSRITDGDGGNDVFSYSQSKDPVNAVALLLEEDGDGSILSLWETFGITEIEVWMTPAGSTIKPPIGKTCATLGT